MHHQIIQHNNFLSKYLLIENQVQEEETMFFICHMIISLQTISFNTPNLYKT